MEIADEQVVGLPEEADEAVEVVDDQKRRNAGLQRKLQQELATRRRLESQLRLAEQQLLSQSLAGLPPEEQAARKAAWEIEARARKLAEDEALMEARAKKLMIGELVSRYRGLTPEELAVFDTPEEMRAHAERVGRDVARQAASDRFESGAAAPARAGKARDLDEAAAMFRQLARRRGLGRN